MSTHSRPATDGIAAFGNTLCLFQTQTQIIHVVQTSLKAMVSSQRCKDAYCFAKIVLEHSISEDKYCTTDVWRPTLYYDPCGVHIDRWRGAPICAPLCPHLASNWTLLAPPRCEMVSLHQTTNLSSDMSYIFPIQMPKMSRTDWIP